MSKRYRHTHKVEPQTENPSAPQTFSGLARESVVNMSASERALGRAVKLTSHVDDVGDASADLLADSFMTLYKVSPKDAREIPQTRTLNRSLLDWASETPMWESARQLSMGNLPVAMTSASLLHAHLSSDDVLKQAMEKQEQAAKDEQAAREAETTAQAMQANARAQAQAAQAAGGNAKATKQAAQAQASAQAAQAQATQARAQAQASAQVLKQALDKAESNNLTQTAVSHAVKKANEGAKEVAQALAQFGHDGGGSALNNADEALKLLARLNDKVKRILKLAGRAHGIAAQTKRERVTTGQVPARVERVQDLRHVFVNELAELAPTAPAHVRALKTCEWLNGGLFGWRVLGNAKERGAFVAFVDVSGSMSSALNWDDDDENAPTREECAKGIALGLARGAREDSRLYTIASFAAQSDPTFVVKSTQSWESHVQWANDAFGGGTSFDKALDGAMQELKALGDEHAKKADVVIISDGEGYVSDETVVEWRKFQDDTGARLVYVGVGDGEGLDAVADITYHVDSLDDDLTKKLADAAL